VFTTCKKDNSLWQIKNLNNAEIGVFGHGGSGSRFRYPINSMYSLNEILKQPVYGTEMDVQISKDKELILFHNFRLEDATNCDGLVSEKNSEELKSCQYKLPWLKGGTELITAKAFFDQVINKDDYHYVFDTKISGDASKEEIADFSEALYSLIKTYKLEERCFIESYNFIFLQALLKLNANLKLFIHSDSYNDGLAVAKQVNLFGITIDKVRITKEEIADAHKRNLRIALFNLDTENKNLEAIKMNPDYMQSDNCEFLLEALR
jgi:glycerophosphoryl diester phosphodiesterase